MKRIKPTQPDAQGVQWPRHAVPAVECRKRDLVIRIADWSRQSLRNGEPGYDVEVYIGGVYDWNESRTFTLREHETKARAKVSAIDYASAQIAKLL